MSYIRKYRIIITIINFIIIYLRKSTKKHSNKQEHKGKICTYGYPYKRLQFNSRKLINLTLHIMSTQQYKYQHKNSVKYIRYKCMKSTQKWKPTLTAYTVSPSKNCVRIQQCFLIRIGFLYLYKITFRNDKISLCTRSWLCTQKCVSCDTIRHDIFMCVQKLTIWPA